MGNGNGVALYMQIAAERDRRKWSQREAAERAGMSLRAYQSFELGKSQPQAKNLRGILRAFELEEDAGEQQPTLGNNWPEDIDTFLNMLGAYMLTMERAQRREFIFGQTRRIFSER